MTGAGALRVLPALALVVGLAACTSATEVVAPVSDESVVEVFGNQRGAEADAMRAVLAAFTEESGIETRFVGTAGFADRLPARIRNADAPDVALVPQPALVTELAREGRLVPLDDVVGDVSETLVDGAEQIGLVDGRRFGVWFRMNVKSLVWYPPTAVAEAGYEQPATLAQLLALSRDVLEDGTAPWCIGVEAFGSTGWVGTDWVEDLVLRLHGPEVYDDWVAGEIPFTDPRIQEAFELFGDFALTEGFVLGGSGATLRTGALRAIDPVLESPPRCLFTRQASFQEQSLPPGTVVGEDGQVDVFVLPSFTGDQPPVLAAGELVVAFDDRPEVTALVSYLAEPRAGVPWAERGGFTSPHASFDRDVYANDFDRELARIVDEAAVVRFDGSDQMPTAVGTGTFWDGIVQYLSGVPLDTVLPVIQAGYGVE